MGLPQDMNGLHLEQDDARRVPMTTDDRKNGAYSVQQLQMALEGLHQDGMVVLQNLVDVDHCDAVYEHMTGDRDRILRERHAGAKVYNQVSQVAVPTDSPSARLTHLTGCEIQHPPSSSFHQARTALRRSAFQPFCRSSAECVS